MDVKKTKNIALSYRIKIKILFCNLNWKRYLSDFDVRYCDLNLIFVFDSSTKTFLTSDIFIKAATMVKKFVINTFFINWFVF